MINVAQEKLLEDLDIDMPTIKFNTTMGAKKKLIVEQEFDIYREKKIIK